MTSADQRVTSAGLLLAALLAACEPRNDIVLQLQCRGDEVVDAQPARRSVGRIYRFDAQASALEIWDPRARRFARWGTGKISIDKKSAAYAGEARSMNENIRVKRKIEFNRSSKQIRDRVEASWGSVAEFDGACEER